MTERDEIAELGDKRLDVFARVLIAAVELRSGVDIRLSFAESQSAAPELDQKLFHRDIDQRKSEHLQCQVTDRATRGVTAPMLPKVQNQLRSSRKVGFKSPTPSKDCQA